MTRSLASASLRHSAAQQAHEVVPKKLAAKLKPGPKAQPKKQPHIRLEPKAPGARDTAA